MGGKLKRERDGGEKKLPTIASKKAKQIPLLFQGRQHTDLERES